MKEGVKTATTIPHLDTPAEYSDLINEQKLVEDFRIGSYEAWEDIGRKVFKVLRTKGANTEEAKELTQETLLRLWNGGLEKFRFDSTLFTYIYRVASNVLIDTLRSKQRKPEHLSLDDENHNHIAGSLATKTRFLNKPEYELEYEREQADLHRNLAAFLKTKNDDDRIIFPKRLEGVSLNDIADKLGNGWTVREVSKRMTELKAEFVEFRCGKKGGDGM